MTRTTKTLCVREKLLFDYLPDFRERLVLDRGGMTDKKIWSMSQFRRMYNSCKTPGEEIDQFNFHFKTGKVAL